MNQGTGHDPAVCTGPGYASIIETPAFVFHPMYYNDWNFVFVTLASLSHVAWARSISSAYVSVMMSSGQLWPMRS